MTFPETRAELRALALDDVPTLVALRRVIHPDVARSVASSRHVFQTDMADQSARHWLSTVDGEPVGYAMVWRDIDNPDPTAGRIHVGVLPDRRSAGIGSSLFEVADRYLADLGMTSVLVYATDDDHTSSFLTRRGFSEASRTVCTRVDPARVAPVVVPDNVTLRTFSDFDDLYPVFLLDVETTQDEPGPFDSSGAQYDPWLVSHSIDPDFDGDLALVAQINDTPVGLASLRVDRDANRAIHSFTGVRAAYRGRGIARTLKQSLLNRAAVRGIVSVTTVNDATNEPIRRINDSFGFEPFCRRISWSRPTTS